MTDVLAGQLDLLAAIEEVKLEAPAPTLYGSPARGLAARAAEYDAWRAEHGSFGRWLATLLIAAAQADFALAVLRAAIAQQSGAMVALLVPAFATWLGH